MSPNRILITAYKNPDLDGTAAAYAYAEFLQKKGQNAWAGIFGIPHQEALFVFAEFNIQKMADAEKLLEESDQIILVDTSDLRGISEKINPKKVIELIDHREINKAGKFPQAKIQIELVGAAATLIAEKFYQANLEISPASAVLLYSAIINNTINFQAKVTTKQDQNMARWLKTKFRLPDDYIHRLFAKQSQFSRSIFDTLLDYCATFEFANKKIGISQLEIIDVNQFLDQNLEEIKKSLTTIKNTKSLDYIFLTCIDVEKYFNRFVTFDQSSQKLLERALAVLFQNGIAKRNGIIMRKEIAPKLKQYLENDQSKP